MRTVSRIILTFLATGIATGAFAQKWSFEFHGGTAYNVPLPLTIGQNGHPDIRIGAARYNSEPFVAPIYWDWRFSRWKNKRSWEFEAVHHKLILTNKPADVQRFSITHGFNMLTVNRGGQTQYFHYRIGLGVVLTHPESRVREQQFNQNLGILDMGYYISGPSLNLAIGHRFYPVKRVFLNVEGKTSLSYVRVPIADGTASLTNLAFHLILGLGFDFIDKE